MGYTVYIKGGKITPKQMGLIVRDFKELLKHTDVPITGYNGEPDTPPVLGPTELRFNGLGEDAHETCYLGTKMSNFEFCKTAEKPYDVLVKAACLLAQFHGKVKELSCDGGVEDWDAAKELIKNALGYETAVLMDLVGDKT